MCGSSFRLRTLKAKIDDESAFISSLAEVAVPAGGWAAYGAHKTIASLIGPDVQHPDYDQIRRTALQFLQSEGYDRNHLNDYAVVLENERGCRVPRVG